MSILDCLRSNRKGSAATAKERLQIVITHERAHRNAPDYLPLLKRELLEVVTKYTKVDQEHVTVRLEQDGECGVLELNILLPETGRAR